MVEQLSLFIIQLIQSTGYFGIFLLMSLESVLIPIPSEITMPFAGFLANKGTLLFPVIVLSGALGNVLGSLISYYIGFFLEEKLLLSLLQRYGKFLLLTVDDYKSSAKWFQKYGNNVIFFARLIPGVRTFISLPAGMFSMNIKKFILYTFLGSLLWSLLLTSIGFYLGSKWTTLGPLFNKLHILIILFVISIVGFFVYHKIKKLTR